MRESNSFSAFFSNLAQFDEIGRRQYGVVFVFGFDNKAGRGVVGVSVNFFDIGLCAVKCINVVRVLKNFLFSSLSFELIELEIVASVMFAAFKSVVLRYLAMKVRL